MFCRVTSYSSCLSANLYSFLLIWWTSVVWNPQPHFLCRTRSFCRTMMSCKNKTRVVLPSRPEPPSMDQILEDIQRAAPDDPVFSILDQKGPGEEEERCGRCSLRCSSGSGSVVFSEPTRRAEREVEVRFQQCRRYLNLNEQLEEAQRGLLLQREELRAVGEELKKEVTRVKGQMQWKMFKTQFKVWADWRDLSGIADYSCLFLFNLIYQWCETAVNDTNQSDWSVSSCPPLCYFKYLSLKRWNWKQQLWNSSPSLLCRFCQHFHLIIAVVTVGVTDDAKICLKHQNDPQR